MREIIFRGKLLDDVVNCSGCVGKHSGEWIEGSLIKSLNGKRFYIGNMFECYEVYNDTVGQYTGLIDKNGTKIFEGDIIEHHAQGDLIVVRGIVNWDADNARWAYQLTTMNPCFTFYNPDAFEVVGNIHDTPELLTEERT